ncbi:hypothetical protein CFP71_18075 [Amycolatopsis thailandensis]|uniref:Uncharacterized protein n=1 Tax=Amycolatopsis thailandensis TaxID=589330 RepID=A0A229S8Y4_9PSEU|nr:hypothetical protein CFP71_18075 [Amycolatopsis thailandensis]
MVRGQRVRGGAAEHPGAQFGRQCLDGDDQVDHAALLTAITVIVPLSIEAARGARITTTAGNLFPGVLITGTLSGVLHSAIRAGRLVR